LIQGLLSACTPRSKLVASYQQVEISSAYAGWWKQKAGIGKLQASYCNTLLRNHATYM
jgi:hypothetical protein